MIADIRRLGFAAVVLAGMMITAGCGESPDVELMKKGLARSGMPAAQADCFATAMDGTVEGETYNFLARLMNEGMSERDAVNRTRRKYSADFKTPMQEARAGCVQ